MTISTNPSLSQNQSTPSSKISLKTTLTEDPMQATLGFLFASSFDPRKKTDEIKTPIEELFTQKLGYLLACQKEKEKLLPSVSRFLQRTITSLQKRRIDICFDSKREDTQSMERLSKMFFVLRAIQAKVSSIVSSTPLQTPNQTTQGSTQPTSTTAPGNLFEEEQVPTDEEIDQEEITDLLVPTPNFLDAKKSSPISEEASILDELVPDTQIQPPKPEQPSIENKLSKLLKTTLQINEKLQKDKEEQKFIKDEKEKILKQLLLLSQSVPNRETILKVLQRNSEHPAKRVHMEES